MNTRDRILFILKTRGEQTTADLARRLELTPMAIRQHLATLEAEGLVAAEDERRSVGRPVKVWSLLPAAAERFPEGYADLSVDLIGALRSTFGEEGVEKLIRERTKQQVRDYRRRIGDEPDLARRVAALARIRKEEGYMAEWSREKSGALLLIENHCPICVAATACTGLCAGELELFRSVLGRRTKIERVEYMLEGSRRCVYRIAGTG